MKKLKIFLLLFILIIFYIYVANITLIPDNINLMQGETLKLSTIWGLNIVETQNSNPNIGNYKTGKLIQVLNNDENTLSEIGKINLNLNIFKNISLKDVTINVIPKTTVIPLGNAIGLKLYTKGVLVVGMSEIDGLKPYENTGIKEGDRIIAVNNITLTSTTDLITTVNNSNGNTVQVKYISSKNEEKVVNILPAKTKQNEYKLGLWVRDAAARSRNFNIL